MTETRRVLFAALLGLLLADRPVVAFWNPSALRISANRSHRWSAIASLRRRSFALKGAFYNDFDDLNERDDDDEEDDEIDLDSLGDWRLFRKNLAASAATMTSSSTSEQLGNMMNSSAKAAERPRSVSKLNEEILKTQSEALYDEYVKGAWAHTTATPEVGGLVVRMPLEAELFRNHRHSMAGAKFRQILEQKADAGSLQQASPHLWFRKAQKMVEREMKEIAELGGDDGHIDGSMLNDERAEFLSLYLDFQETWQEVCLCLERDEAKGTASTIVLNRPMSFKLTDHLARLCLYGTEMKKKGLTLDETDVDKVKFMMAFRNECAIYVGGPDDQHKPAEIVHGIANLPGAVEISAGTGIYRGGLEAAINGVLKGIYKPLDFRFFMGKHKYDESMLDLNVVLGKYQPIACSRSLVLKQCISLPKPLWHEVMEICGGEMKELSRLEHNKKDGMQYEIVEDDDEYLDDDEEFEIFLDDGENMRDIAMEVFEEFFREDDDTDDA